MLVLSRKPSESIIIGDSIVVKVIRTGRNTVSLGIIAPDDIRVLRGEIAFQAQQAFESEGTLEDEACRAA